MRRMAVAAALMAGAAAWAHEAPFVIAEKGAPAGCVINLPASPSPSQETAAAELREHVRKMTGVDLAVTRGATTSSVRRVAIRSWTEKGEDAFRLRVSPDALTVEGGARGVLYGVYELLERFGGCRWYASWHTVVPERAVFSVPADFQDEQIPAFDMRFPFWHDVRQNPRFAARLRVNGPYSAKPADPALGGVPYRWGGGLGNCHTFQKLCPVGKYGKTHPEYFALHNGVRDVYSSEPQLCLTNPDVLKLVTAETLARIRKDPQAGRYGVSQNDNERYCTCENCRRVDEEEGSHAGTMIRFVNAVAEAVEKEFPQAVVETLAYQYTRRPPAKTRPRKNVLICLCTIECDFSQPLLESRYQTNVDFVRDIEGWARLTKRLYVWDYTVNFAHYLMPTVNFDALAGNVRFFKRNSVTDLFEQGVSTRNEGYHAFFAELKAYALAKLLWNPDLDEEALFDDFICGYYGKGAPAIKMYFNALREKERAWRTRPGGELTIYQTPAETPFDEVFLDQADALHRQALAAVAEDDPVYAYNIRMSQLALDYTRFYLTYHNVNLVDPLPDADAAAQASNCLRRIAAALKGPRRVIFSQYHGTNARMHELAAHPERLSGRGRRRPGYAEIEDAVCGIRSPEEARRVDDPLAEDGRAIECFGGRHGWCVNIFGFGNIKVKPEAKYRVRVRVRVDPQPGANGKAFWSGIYGWPPASCDRIRREVTLAEVPDAGYAWYDLGVWKPTKGDYFWFGAGLFNRKNGETSSVKSVYLDKFDLTELDERAAGGDFESGLGNWKGMPPEYALAPGMGRGGSTALGFKNDDPEVRRFPRLPIQLEADRFYRFEVWVKTALRKRATSGASVFIEWDDEKGRHLGGAYTRGASGTSEWTRVTGVTPRIPANARNFRISPAVARGFTGEAWFDDLSVVPYDRPPVGAMTVSAYRKTVAGGPVRFCVALEMPESRYPALEKLRGVFRVSDEKGAVSEYPADAFVRDRAEITLDTGAWTPGRWTVAFDLLTESDERLGRAECVVTRVATRPALRVSFDRFNRTLIDGRPFFPLGMYWANPVTAEDAAIYAKGPFNALMPYRPLTDEVLTICRTNGLMTCGVCPWPLKGASRERARKYVMRYRHDPALLAWYVNDEAPLTRLPELIEKQKFLEALDPQHPTWAVEDKCSQVRDFLPSFDVIGTDPYPIPVRPLSMAGDWTRQTREATYGIRPIWQVPQAFDFEAYRKLSHVKDRAPTMAEIRTMTWLCIAEGANGIFLYSFHDLKKRIKGVPFEERWRVVCDAVRDVKEKMPILLADPAPAPSAPAGVSVRAWTLGGVRHILAVNGGTETVAFTPGPDRKPVDLAAGEHRFFTLPASR